MVPDAELPWRELRGVNMYISVNTVFVIICLVVLLAVILFYEHRLHVQERRLEHLERILDNDVEEELRMLKYNYNDLINGLRDQHTEIQRLIRQRNHEADNIASRLTKLIRQVYEWKELLRNAERTKETVTEETVTEETVDISVEMDEVEEDGSAL